MAGEVQPVRLVAMCIVQGAARCGSPGNRLDDLNRRRAPAAALAAEGGVVPGSGISVSPLPYPNVATIWNSG